MGGGVCACDCACNAMRCLVEVAIPLGLPTPHPVCVPLMVCAVGAVCMHWSLLRPCRGCVVADTAKFDGQPPSVQQFDVALHHSDTIFAVAEWCNVAGWCSNLTSRPTRVVRVEPGWAVETLSVPARPTSSVAQSCSVSCAYYLLEPERPACACCYCLARQDQVPPVLAGDYGSSLSIESPGPGLGFRFQSLDVVSFSVTAAYDLLSGLFDLQAKVEEVGPADDLAAAMVRL
jgi:hypothetical protein